MSETNATPQTAQPAALSWICKTLYQTPAVMDEFLKTRQTPPVNLVMKDNRIVSVIRQQEPGPAVDYSVLQANLLELELHLKAAPQGAQLLTFFATLVDLRQTWLHAAIRFETFKAYSEVLNQYYIWGPATHDAEQLRAFEQERQTFFTTDKPTLVENQYQSLLRQMNTAGSKLSDFKLSREFWHASHNLWQAIQLYDRHLWDAERREQVERTGTGTGTGTGPSPHGTLHLRNKTTDPNGCRGKKRQGLKVRNLRDVAAERQLGAPAGSSPNVEQVVMGWMRQMIEEQEVGYKSPTKKMVATDNVAAVAGPVSAGVS